MNDELRETAKNAYREWLVATTPPAFDKAAAEAKLAELKAAITPAPRYERLTEDEVKELHRQSYVACPTPLTVFRDGLRAGEAAVLRKLGIEKDVK